MKRGVEKITPEGSIRTAAEHSDETGTAPTQAGDGAQLAVVDYGRCAVKGAFNLAQGKKVPIAVRGAANKVIEKATVSELPNWEEQIEEIFGRS
mgnify:CR=1 FL=1